MKKQLGIAALSVGALGALGVSTAMAAPFGYSGGGDNDSTYVGVNGGILRYDEQGLNTISPSLIFARAGFPIVSNLAIEGRIGTGLNGDSSDGYGVNVQTMLGVYLKGSLPLSQVFSLYGVAGVGNIELHRNFGDSNTNDTGLSLGIGGDVQLVSNVSLNFEWTHLPGGDDYGYSYNSNILSAGLTWHF
jgi:opacity protein-like surface antigen